LSSQSTKLAFLAAMEKQAGLFTELSTFLMEEKVATEKELREIFAKPIDFRAMGFYALIMRCETQMQMVDWEWTLLPAEYMKLTMVTRNGVKEFVWTA
jgi:hypothetical protein